MFLKLTQLLFNRTDKSRLCAYQVVMAEMLGELDYYRKRCKELERELSTYRAVRR